MALRFPGIPGWSGQKATLHLSMHCVSSSAVTQHPAGLPGAVGRVREKRGGMRVHECVELGVGHPLHQVPPREAEPGKGQSQPEATE